jgi:hypothetical protein
MAKKLRKALRKIAKVGIPAAILGGLALKNKGKGMEMSNIEVDSGRGGDSSSAMARIAANTPTPVYRDDIMRGGSGVKNMRRIPGIVVDKPIGSFPFLGLKKGGRVKKGFAKKKKQANKMRKK